MTEERDSCFSLQTRSRDDLAPVLTGVQVEGRLDGLLYRTVLRQSYRHSGRRPLEVVYTFPLPPQAVLLGFAAQFGDRLLQGRVMARADAEREYEEALAEGDAPVLLEAGPDGLHTANIGNLMPGEDVHLEIRFAQFLAFEQGRLRLSLPTTLAPRYGNAEAGGLQPQQVPPVSMETEYPLQMAVTLTGMLASATVDCPTHPVSFSRMPDGLRLNLMPSARLDRDVVIWVTPAGQQVSLLAVGNDPVAAEDGHVTLAAFELKAPEGERTALALKLLVDCSGSMGGDSMASARRALLGVVSGLREADQVSLTRFGTDSALVFPPQKATAKAVRRLQQAIETTDASMGGTEMEQALTGTISMPLPFPVEEGPADILLITDGEVWDADAVIDVARRSDHRVFVIGVGTSPAEGMLRRLAQATGGACEFATPGEALEAAAQRMLARMRQPLWARLEVDWGQPAGVTAAWSHPEVLRGFGGDTVMALAGWAHGLPGDRTVRLLGTTAQGQVIELGEANASVACPGDDLARMAAALRARACESNRDDRSAQALAKKLALDYQLVGPHTHCVLVHRRAEEDKPGEDAELHRVSSMLAAGWGGTGTVQGMKFGKDVNFVASPDRVYYSKRSSQAGVSAGHSVASVWRTRRASQSGAPVDVVFDDLVDGSDADALPIPDWLRRQPGGPSRSARRTGPAMTLEQIADLVAAHLAQGGGVGSLHQSCKARNQAIEVMAAVAHLTTEVGDESLAWLLLGLWVAQRPGDNGNPSVAALLAEPVNKTNLTTIQRQRGHEILEGHLSGFSSDSWRSSRWQRLQRALSGSHE